MTAYRRKAREVQAVRWDGSDEALAAVRGLAGVVSVTPGGGLLGIIHLVCDNKILNLYPYCPKCWLVAEDGDIDIYADEEFAAEFEPVADDCRGRCEFHGRLWCNETGRSCSEFMALLEAR